MKSSARLLRVGVLAGVLTTLVSAQGNCFDAYLIFPDRLDEPDIPVGAPPETPASADLIDFTHAVLDGCTDVELTGIRSGASLMVQSIATAIEDDETGHCPKSLILASSLIDDDGALALARVIKANYPIRKIDINFNLITDVGALAIADALMKNTALKTINLAWNRIGPRGRARLSAFGPKKSGPYKRKVILEDQFLENGDLPPGVEPIPEDVPMSEIGEVWKPACDNPPCDRNKIVQAMDALEVAKTELAAMKATATPEEIELASKVNRINPEVDKANARLAASMKMLAEARKATAKVVNDPIQAAIKAANDAIAQINGIEAQSAAATAQAIADDEVADAEARAAGGAGGGGGAGANNDAAALAKVKASVEMLDVLEAEMKAIVAEEKQRRQGNEGANEEADEGGIGNFDVLVGILGGGAFAIIMQLASKAIGEY